MTNKTFVIHPVAGPRFAYLPEGRDDIQEANARLIAAAPDLLEACKAALERIDGMNEAMGVVDELRRAIARAEGGAA